MEIYQTLFNICVSIIILINSLFFLNSYISLYKNKKVKEDYLYVEKSLITFICYIFYMIICLFNILDENSGNSSTSINLSLIQLHIFNLFIPAFYIIRLFMSLEFYLTFKRPNYIFNSIIYNYKSQFYYEIIIILISLTSYFFDITYYNNDKNIIIGNNLLYLNPFYIFDFYKWSILTITSLMSFLLYLNTFKLVKPFIFKTQKKLISVCKKNIILSFLYIIYGIEQGIGISIIKISQRNSKIKNYDNLNILSSITSFLLLFIDSLIEFYYLSISKFSQYKLRKTIIGLIGKKLRKEITENIQNTPLESISYSYESFSLSSFSQEINEILIPSPGDEELINCYNNGYIFEDYIFDYYDCILNISLFSIFNIYQTKNFSKRAQTRNMRKAFNVSNTLSISEIPNDSYSSNQTNTNTFNFKINKKKNDFKKFEHILNYKIDGFNRENFSNLNVDISYFNVSNILQILNSKELNVENITNSLLNHLQTKNKNSIDSLISLNIQDQSFQYLNYMSLKTKDKGLNIDIFHSEMKPFSENFDNYLQRYFFHTETNPTSFLPIILGIFKIKINNFKPLLIIITQNSLVENRQKDTYSFWQLVRFNNQNKVLSLSSSQITNDSLLIKNDPIFERSYEIETKKDDINLNKILLKNYNEFIDILQKDIQCLKLLGVKKFNLLMMYYEYENTQKHEKEGNIKIKKKGSKAEIINIGTIQEINDSINFTLPNDIINDDNLSDHELETTDEINFNNYNSNNIDLNVIDNNFEDFNYKINLSSYDGTFHHFNCLCYFMFENLFDLTKRFENNFYDKFYKNVIEHFANFSPVKK